MSQQQDGEVYTIPAGLTVHCAQCGRKLESGDQCYIEQDSSSIYCLKHIPKLREKPAEPEPGWEPLWMAYE